MNKNGDVKGVKAVIAGFGRYGTGAGNEYESGTKITVNEVYDLLKQIRALIDPEFIGKLYSEFDIHTRDENNPHRVTWDQLDTTVLHELYKAWLAEGNEGDLEHFVDILFQWVQIADLEETLEGTSKTKITSVYGVAKSIQLHNESTEVHRELVEGLFGGDPIHSPNTLLIDPIMNNHTDGVISEREGSATYVNSRGFIESTEQPRPTDYTIGVPCFAIWGERTNRVPTSEGLSSMTLTEGVESSSVNMEFIREEFRDVPTITSSGSGALKGIYREFGCSGVATFSAFIKKLTCRYAYVALTGFLAGQKTVEVGYWVDLQSGYTDEMSYVDTQQVVPFESTTVALANETYRCGICADLSSFADTVRCGVYFVDGFSMEPLNIPDGNSLIVDGFSYEDGEGMSPYIQTTGAIATRNASHHHIVLDRENTNGSCGMFGYSGFTASLFSSGNTFFSMFRKDVVGAPNGAALTHKYQESGGKKLPVLVCNDNAGSTMAIHRFSDEGGQCTGYGVGYGANTTSYFTFSKTGELPVILEKPLNKSILQNPTKLHIGEDHTLSGHLDGYIRSLIYYPLHGKSGNIQYLVAGEDELPGTYKFKHFRER